MKITPAMRASRSTLLAKQFYGKASRAVKAVSLPLNWQDCVLHVVQLPDEEAVLTVLRMGFWFGQSTWWKRNSQWECVGATRGLSGFLLSCRSREQARHELTQRKFTFSWKTIKTNFSPLKVTPSTASNHCAVIPAMRPTGLDTQPRSPVSVVGGELRHVAHRASVLGSKAQPEHTRKTQMPYPAVPINATLRV